MPSFGFSYPGAFGANLGTAPFVGNVYPGDAPSPGDLIGFSVRHGNAYPGVPLDLSKVRAYFGHGGTRAPGDFLFDSLPHTVRSSTLPGTFDEDRILELSGGRVALEKTSVSPQRTVYATRLSEGRSLQGYLVGAQIKADEIVVGTGHAGALLGLDLGFCNSAVYFFLQKDGAARKVALRGPGGSPSVTAAFDWPDTGTYYLVYDAISQTVSAYLDDGGLSRLVEAAVSSFAPHGPSSRRLATGNEVLALYGVEGGVGMRSAFGPVFLPEQMVALVGNGGVSHTYAGRVQGAERIAAGPSPLTQPSGRFFLLPAEDRDALGTVTETGGACRLHRPTPNTTYVLSRDDTDFRMAAADGFRVRVTLSGASPVTDLFTGMGLSVWDGSSLFSLTLVQSPRGRGVALRKSGAVTSASSYAIAHDVDWATPVSLVLEVDGRRNEVSLYGEGEVSPLLTLPFDRAKLPNGSATGLSGKPPRISFGHEVPVAASGTLTIHALEYTPVLQHWRAESGELPNEAMPAFSIDGGSLEGTVSLSNEALVLLQGAAEAGLYRRAGYSSAHRGQFVEAEVFLDAEKVGPSGVVLGLSDDEKLYAVTFVRDRTGPYLALFVAGEGGEPTTSVGDRAEEKKYSVRLDWSEPHVYRVTVDPFSGVLVEVDGKILLRAPKSVLPEAVFPGQLFFGSGGDFGALQAGPRTSYWKHVCYGTSTGYEFSFAPPTRLSGAAVTLAYVEE